MASHQLPPPGLLMAPPVVMASAAIPVSGSSARPGSMSELARMAKIPQPEPGLKCPRCPSTNTKFCYFNNYSLTQPRYFCKACRRYWTSGGTLRNVPVGGGCRRNKRSRKLSKKPSSPSPASATAATASIALGAGASSSAAATVMPPPFPFHFGTSHSMECDGYVTLGTSRLGLFPGLNSSSSMHQRAVDYHHQLGDGLGLERSQLPPVQQFRFNIAGVQPPPQGRPLMLSGSYPFDDAEEGNAVVEAATRLAGGMPASAGMAGSSGLITQMAAVKMDNNDPTLAMGSPGELLDGGSLQFWGGGGDRGGGTGGCVASGGGWPSSDLLTFDLS